jgi:hypothetical protein
MRGKNKFKEFLGSIIWDEGLHKSSQPVWGQIKKTESKK